jgi:hypothetical protein
LHNPSSYTQGVSKSRNRRLRVKERSVYEIHEYRRPRKTTNPEFETRGVYKASITPEMALRLAKFCGNTPSFRLRMQQQWDLWDAEKKLREELKEIPGHAESLH